MNQISGVISPLSDEESSHLAQLEGVVQAGFSSMTETALALLKIKEKRLYRYQYGTYEQYARKRWGLSKAHANRLIQAGTVIKVLTPMGAILPANERQVRPLTKLNLESVPAVWSKVVEEADGSPITNELVEKVVKETKSGEAASNEAETQTPPRQKPLPGGRTSTPRERSLEREVTTLKEQLSAAVIELQRLRGDALTPFPPDTTPTSEEMMTKILAMSPTGSDDLVDEIVKEAVKSGHQVIGVKLKEGHPLNSATAERLRDTINNRLTSNNEALEQIAALLRSALAPDQLQTFRSQLTRIPSVHALSRALEKS